MQRYPFRQIVRQYVSANAACSDIWGRLIMEPPAFVLSWLLLNLTAIRANHVTLLGLASAATGAAASAVSGNPVWLVSGYLLHLLLDYVDGCIARARQSSSRAGMQLDFMTDRTALMLCCLSLCWVRYQAGACVELPMLMAYYMLYVQVDMLCYMQLAADLRYPPMRDDKPPTSEACPPRWRDDFSQPLKWLPTQITSPLVGIIVSLLAGDPAPGYAAAAGSLLVNYYYLTMPAWNGLRRRVQERARP